MGGIGVHEVISGARRRWERAGWAGGRNPGSSMETAYAAPENGGRVDQFEGGQIRGGSSQRWSVEPESKTEIIQPERRGGSA